jgi:hypothetical protein
MTYLFTIVVYAVLSMIAAVVVIGGLWVVIHLAKRLFK